MTEQNMWTSSFRFADNVYADIIAVSQRMGSHTTTGHKIGMDSTDDDLDTVLCFPCGAVCVESG